MVFYVLEEPGLFPGEGQTLRCVFEGNFRAFGWIVMDGAKSSTTSGDEMVVLG